MAKGLFEQWRESGGSSYHYLENEANNFEYWLDQFLIVSENYGGYERRSWYGGENRF